MAIAFLQQHGARRMGEGHAPPIMHALTSARDDDEPQSEHEEAIAREKSAPKVELNFETAPAQWKPIRVADCGQWHEMDDWPLRPLRFVDGKDVGRTVAWMQTREGFPVPLRLSIVGAIAMRNEDGYLKREWHDVQRVLTMAVDCFEGDVDQFAAELAAGSDQIQLRAVPCPPEGLGFDWERTGGRTRRISHGQMNALEKQALRFDAATPTLVDGPLDSHNGAFSPEVSPVIGLIKSHHVEYFAGDADCWRVLYGLEPGERTPAFVINRAARFGCDTVSWYLRLCGTGGEMPNWGIVRIEVARAFFESLGEPNEHRALDRWSRLICEYRCRDESYGRAPVSIHPIVRAEQSLGEVFTSLDSLTQRFYRLSGL